MLHARPTLRLFGQKRHAGPLRKCIPAPWRNLMTLAIETSCDDTAVAILEKDSTLDNEPIRSLSSNELHPQHQSEGVTSSKVKGLAPARLLFNEKITAPNTGLGGIHPIEALASHQTNLARLVSKAINSLPDVASADARANHRVLHHSTGGFKQIPDFISVTRGPGMRSNLQCGLDTAKGLATAWQIPLLGVHHMQAHALTPRLVSALENISGDSGEITGDRRADPMLPFLTLLVSGGHTMLLHSEGLTDHKIIATTADIAIGDALDKSGRMILPQHIKDGAKDTAFAKHLSDYAFPDPDSYRFWSVPQRRKDEVRKAENQFGWQIQAPFADTRKLSFSFTAIPSTVERILQKRDAELSGDGEERRLLARAALGTAFEHLASRTIIALEAIQSVQQNVSTLVVSGGVAANPFLRFFLRSILDVRGFEHIRLLFPPPLLCTDNAAMIAWCGMEMYEAGFRSELNIEARRKWSMDPAAQDGGILGVGGWTHINCV